MDVQNIVKDLKRDEGKRLKPYLCPEGKLTIGYGRNIEDNGISESEAELLLSNDVRYCISLLERFDFWVELDAVRRDVLINMCFNLGYTKFARFKRMLQAIQLHDYAQAADEMKDSRWFLQVGDRSKRLEYMMRYGERNELVTG